MRMNMRIPSILEFCYFTSNKVTCGLKSVYIDFTVYSVLFIATISMNKYVLSVLKFTYPTVFQAWQTLVGAIVLKYLNIKKSLDVTTLDRTLFLHLLPHCLFYVAGIVSGSKALSRLPIPVFVCVCNLPLVCIFLLDYITSPARVSLVRVTACILCLLAAISVVLLDFNQPFSDSGYFWLMAHVLCLASQSLISRISEPRYTEIDKLYYCYVFSIILLAPASFYLEEAFSALQFQHRRQIRFYVGCVFSGVLGVLLQLWTLKMQNTPVSLPLVRSIASILSVSLFGNEIALGLWMFVSVSLVSSLLIPVGPEIEENVVNI